MMVIGPVPEQQEDGGLIECYHRSEPAELPGILDKGEKNTKRGKQKTFQTNKNKRGQGAPLTLLFCLGLLFGHNLLGSKETRRTLKLSINDTIQGEQTCG